MKDQVDYLVAGAGIMGLTVVRELQKRQPTAKIILLEKEPSVGVHASGRNSGVVHRGIYYAPGSLKAKFCVEGAELLEQYCIEHNLRIDRCGKVILPLRADDDSQMDILYGKAQTNGASITLIDQKTLTEIEPAARSLTGRALHSPLTAVVDPKQVLENLTEEIRSRGAQVIFNAKVEDLDLTQKECRTSQGTYAFGHLINTTGLYADVIAKRCGLARKYVALPFKGKYAKLKPQPDLSFRGLIYPVPDPNVPFLGVHFTKSIEGTVYIGPTAMPALGRENYRGLQGIEWADLASIGTHLLQLYLANKQGFRNFAHQEIGHLSRHQIWREARTMVPLIDESHIVASPKVGIRAQLLNRESGELMMDFFVEHTPESTHVLNVVSPGLTSSLSFAKYVVDRALGSSDRNAGELSRQVTV